MSELGWTVPRSFRGRARPAVALAVVLAAAVAVGAWLARGWYQQVDVAANPVLYSKHLDAATYRRWLRSAAVEYVLLASTPLDWDGGPREARIIRSRNLGLRLVFHSRNWAVYLLPHPTPLVTGPGSAHVTAFGHTTIRGVVSLPGRYLVRMHYSPYLRLEGLGCVAPAPAKMTWLELRRPGPFSLSVPGTPAGLLDALVDGHACGC